MYQIYFKLHWPSFKSTSKQFLDSMLHVVLVEMFGEKILTAGQSKFSYDRFMPLLFLKEATSNELENLKRT